MKDLTTGYQPIRRTGAEAATISADTPAELEAYRSRHAIPFRMLSDPSLRVITMYGVGRFYKRRGLTIPGVFIVDQERIVRHSIIGRMVLRIRTDHILRLLQTL